ncbi:hypothetical protein QF000_000267 [Paraburkholderia atlantica]
MELPHANAMHQLQARNRDRGSPESLEPEQHIRSGLDVTMALSIILLRHFEERTFDVPSQSIEPIELH